jgi:hypothetical protein
MSILTKFRLGGRRRGAGANPTRGKVVAVQKGHVPEAYTLHIATKGQPRPRVMRVNGISGQIVGEKIVLYGDAHGPLLLVTPSVLEALVRRQVAAELPRMLQLAQEKTDPLAAARARGEKYKQSELASPDNLTLSDAAKSSGFSEKWINTLRQRGELFALVDSGRERGFRYPSWQFAASKERLVPVLNALSAAGIGCWGIHAFMNNASSDLNGRSPRDCILDSGSSLQDVLEVVRRRFVEDQGAQ